MGRPGKRAASKKLSKSLRASPDDIPDVQQASWGKASRRVASVKAPHQASAANLAGRPELCSGCNGRLIKCLLRAHAARPVLDTICTCPCPRRPRKRDGHRRKPRGDTRTQGGCSEAAAASIGTESTSLLCSITVICCCLQVVPVYILLLRSVQKPVLRILDF